MTAPAPDSFLALLLSGQYLPAIGLALIALVALARVLLGKRFPWFATKAGGYALGFGSAFATHIGAALQQGQVPSLVLLGHAVGIGWAASGGWEMVRDLLTYYRSGPVAPKATASIVAVALVVGLLGCSGCKRWSGDGSGPLAPVVECAVADQGQIVSLIKEFKSLLVGEWPNWVAIEQKSVAAGVMIGGCALAQYVQTFLSGRRLTPLPIEETHSARGTLEQFRAERAGGATFRTSAGDL